MKLTIFVVLLVVFQVSSISAGSKYTNNFHVLRVRRQATTSISGALISAIKAFQTSIQSTIATIKANAKSDLQTSIEQLKSRIATIEANPNLSATQKTCIADVKTKITQVQIDTALNSCLDPKYSQLTTDLNNLNTELTAAFVNVDFVVGCIAAPGGTIAGCLIKIMSKIDALKTFGDEAEVQLNKLVAIIKSAFGGIIACVQNTSRDSCKSLISLSMDVADCLNLA